ncbi:MAG: hypothetical protein GX444_01455 [Myxococcales bacterium]|nr:hypothetical protein [Myxococcales bacterium]
MSWEGGTGYEPVGCAVVTPDRNPGSQGKIRYWQSNIRWSDTAPNNGFFFAQNYSPNEYAFQADANEAVVLSPVTRLLANNLVFVRVLYDAGSFPSNPTQGGCE